MTQQPIHALDGVGMCFADEMFCGDDEIVCMPMVRRIKSCVNMANFIREFLEVFCFSSANLKPNEPLCGAVYCGPEPDVFLKFTHNSSSSKTSTFSYFYRLYLISHRPFYAIHDRNTANFKDFFDSPKSISFQTQLYCFLPDMLRVAALAYRVVASTLFAQISLFFIVESAFYSFFAPAFRAFKFFIHAFILHCISDLSNAWILICCHYSI